MDLECIPGTMGVRWKHTLGGMSSVAGHHALRCAVIGKWKIIITNNDNFPTRAYPRVVYFLTELSIA